MTPPARPAGCGRRAVAADWSGGGPAACASTDRRASNLETTARELYSLLWALAERSQRRHASRSTASCSPRSSTPRRWTWSTAMLDRGRDARWGCRWAASGSRTSSNRAGRRRSCRRSRSRAADRLCALVFGLADYSADLGTAIDRQRASHWPTGRAPRSWTSRAPSGVPAIDGMTLDYPVADPALDAAANRDALPGPDAAGLSRCASGRATSGCWASGSVTLRSCSGCCWRTRPACSRRALEAEAAKLAGIRRGGQRRRARAPP